MFYNAMPHRGHSASETKSLVPKITNNQNQTHGAQLQWAVSLVITNGHL